MMMMIIEGELESFLFFLFCFCFFMRVWSFLCRKGRRKVGWCSFRTLTELWCASFFPPPPPAGNALDLSVSMSCTSKICRNKYYVAAIIIVVGARPRRGSPERLLGSVVAFIVYNYHGACYVARGGVRDGYILLCKRSWRLYYWFIIDIIWEPPHTQMRQGRPFTIKK